MSRRRLVDAQTGFRGGLNTVADESQLTADQFRRGVNVRITEQGAARKRWGSKRIHTTAFAAPVQGGYTWMKASTAEELVVADGKLWSGALPAPVTWTERTGALDATAHPAFASFRDGSADVVYIADGGLLNKYDGATLTINIASTPAVKMIHVYNRRLFGVTGEDESLYWSDLDNGDTLGIPASGGGQAVVRTFGDQKLTTIYPFGESLFLFHVSGISKFTGWSQDDINIQAGVRGVSGDIGTIAKFSIVDTERGLLFLSDRGVMWADESGVAPASPLIEVDLTQLSLDDLEHVRAIHRVQDREVWFYIPGRGVYVFNYRSDTWTGPWTGGFTAVSTITHSMWESVDEDFIPRVHVGDAAGFVKNASVEGIGLDNVDSDGTDGDSYTMELQLHRMFCGSMAAEKSFRWAYVLFDSDDSLLSVFRWSVQMASGTFAFGSSSAWGTGTWGEGTWGGTGTIPFRIPIHGSGAFVDITITDTSDKSPLFSRVEVEAFDMGRRG